MPTPTPPQTERLTPEQVIAMFRQLRKRYESGSLQRDKYLSLLKNFMFYDEKRRSWTIGARSERWYYHDGKRWIGGSPPQALFAFRALPRPPPPHEPSDTALSAENLCSQETNSAENAEPK